MKQLTQHSGNGWDHVKFIADPVNSDKWHASHLIAHCQLMYRPSTDLKGAPSRLHAKFSSLKGVQVKNLKCCMPPCLLCNARHQLREGGVLTCKDVHTKGICQVVK